MGAAAGDATGADAGAADAGAADAAAADAAAADAADEPTKVSADAVRRASAFSSAAACHKDWYLCFGDVSHPAGNLESNVDNVIACETSKLNALASGVKRNECDFKRTEAMLCSSCWS